MNDNHSQNGASSDKKWPVLEGRPLKNGKRVYYDTKYFGNWVKYWRREEKDMSAEEAVANLEKTTGRKLNGSSEWRNKYEKQGMDTPHSHITKSGERGVRHNPITIEKCKDISMALGIPLHEVIAEARTHTEWVDNDKDMLDVDWDTWGLILSDYPKVKAAALPVVKALLDAYKAQSSGD